MFWVITNFLRESPVPKIKKILIVDDENDQSYALQQLFTMSGHSNVGTAISGEEALIRLQQGDVPDCIISDMKMLGMNGLELLNELKKRREYQHIRFILLSGTMDDVLCGTAMKQGADGCFRKPFRFDELVRTLEQLEQT